MGIDKIILHIDQDLKPSEITSFLAEAMARRTKINEVLLLLKEEVYELTRQNCFQKKLDSSHIKKCGASEDTTTLEALTLKRTVQR